MEKERIKKARATVQKQYKNKDKGMLKTTLQPQKQILYQMRSLNLLKTLGHHVHLEEGQTTHIHNLCIPLHFEKWRLYWSLSPS
jgi:hypothetical protein